MRFLSSARSEPATTARRDEKAKLSQPCGDEIFKTQVEGAQDYRTDADLHVACEPDAKQICPNVKPGEGRIQDCLVSFYTADQTWTLLAAYQGVHSGPRSAAGHPTPFDGLNRELQFDRTGVTCRWRIMFLVPAKNSRRPPAPAVERPHGRNPRC